MFDFADEDHTLAIEELDVLADDLCCGQDPAPDDVRRDLISYAAENWGDELAEVLADTALFHNARYQQKLRRQACDCA